MSDSQSTTHQFAPEDAISACDSNGKKVAIRTDYTLAADEEASLSEAAERIAKYIVGFSLTHGGLELAVNSHPFFLQVHGKSLWIKYTGEVEADSIWSQEVVEFAKLIGKHFAGFYDIAVENARLRERIAELESQAQADARDALTPAARDVLAERARQISSEGWTPERDDEYRGEELALGAAWYATPTFTRNTLDANDMSLWPVSWADSWFKPGDRRRELTKAGAFVLAEIERIDRAAIAAAKGEQA